MSDLLVRRDGPGPARYGERSRIGRPDVGKGRVENLGLDLNMFNNRLSLDDRFLYP